jgi:2-octaprenyl-6-methoxyphenol hydroxylase
MPQTRIVIGGGAMAGLALGLALRQGLGESAEIVIADPALATRPSRDPRASAIIAAGQNLFRALGVWEKIAPEAQPIHDMIVTDSKLDDVMRPVFLTFAGEAAADREAKTDSALQHSFDAAEPFAHMIENRFVVDALVDTAIAQGVKLKSCSVAGFENKTHCIAVKLSDGTAVDASLLVEADGARSALRERAGIATHGWDYDQSGIVVTVAHERDHDGRAEEHFLPAGPFAILPLKGKRSSLVWTETRKEAERIVALDDEGFHAELEKRFGLHLGELRSETKPRAFPLGYFVARSFIADRLALVGDAAHVIHPIAGQGLNLGLKDVAALAEVIVDAARLGIDPGQADVLERYQQWRRFDTMAMGATTNGLNLLFSNRSNVLRTVRDIGLGLVDRVPILKNALIKQAAGMSGDIPRLLRGEVL